MANINVLHLHLAEIPIYDLVLIFTVSKCFLLNKLAVLQKVSHVLVKGAVQGRNLAWLLVDD